MCTVQLVPAVTELVISELLWLNYSSPEKPVYVYLNSIGSQGPDGQAVGFETEAYAILDTLAYIRPEIHTLVVGQAYGNAAMILASGKKGNRFSLPNARIMTAPPRMNRSFGSVSNMMIKANELEYNTQSYVDFLSQYTGKVAHFSRLHLKQNFPVSLLLSVKLLAYSSFDNVTLSSTDLLSVRVLFPHRCFAYIAADHV